MKNLKFMGALFLVLWCNGAGAQKFLSRQSAEPLSFKQMQLQFDHWKQTTDLKKQKGWKYFKRWEMDMQMHTDAQGNPGDPAVYIEALTKAAREKQTDASAKFNVGA